MNVNMILLIFVILVTLSIWVTYKFIKWLTSPVEYKTHIKEEDYRKLKEKYDDYYYCAIDNLVYFVSLSKT